MPFGHFLLIVAAALFLIGSVEVFVETVDETAVKLDVSAFFLTVVLAGIDLEDAIIGLAAVVIPGNGARHRLR